MADAYNAMTSDRPYRPAMVYPAARDRLLQAMGSQFHIDAVVAFLSRCCRASPRTIATREAPVSARRRSACAAVLPAACRSASRSCVARRLTSVQFSNGLRACRRSRWTCALTVLSAIKNLRPISAFERPSQTRAYTSRSRGERVVTGSTMDAADRPSDSSRSSSRARRTRKSVCRVSSSTQEGR